MVKLRHCLIHDITERLESFSLNTVVSKFMEYNNKMIDIAKKTGGIDKETLSTYVILFLRSLRTLQKNCGRFWVMTHPYLQQNGRNMMKTL